MIKAGHNIMLSRYYVKSTGVQDAGESLQPDPHGSGIPHTYKAGAGDPWPAPDPEPMATRSPIESGSIKPKAGDPAGALGIHGDPVAGVTC